MNSTVKETKPVSKKEFEKAWVDLIDQVRIMDQKLSTKADEVVLTMSLTQRQEMEELKQEVLKLRYEIKRLKRSEKKSNNKQTISYSFEGNPFKNWFKKMHFARK
ncbi:hypothetical protein NC797_09565 [Aquibacillus sp. 3ASR75-11]|uniref:Uncharacterized protein n=1 Tax=Terrihalobacillus insolitus TaxID=2950438 RepID=A0A9X3WVC8_9BACI|nr:hypothetical protein [Terrihalobacillus insolitus]MDC3413014.1 hypothetical protein [Terrihalobacillus insolitus]MDC3424756.1 hypothetical protein [Terrihalobacillus insolitus]